MQKKLNDEKLNMEQRIKDFMKNEKLQYQKLLLKTQAEKDIIFRKAKGILSQQQFVPTLVLENGIDRSERLSETNMSQPRFSTISQDESGLSDTSFEASPNTTSFTLDEKIKQAMSTPSFQSKKESKITLSKQPEQPKLSFKKSSEVTLPSTEDDDLTQKSFHYRKMVSKNLSRTYTPGAFFNFDEEEPETTEDNETQNEEEEEELDSTTETEELLSNNVANTEPQVLSTTTAQQPRTRRRLEFRQPSQLPKPQVNLYGSSVPISIPMRPMRLENTGGAEKLPLYYEATDKQVTPEQRKERTKSFKTKPRLDDDPFTEVPQSYIERYMTFRDEYIKKIEDVPSSQEEEHENTSTTAEHIDLEETEQTASTESHKDEDDFSLENDDNFE